MIEDCTHTNDPGEDVDPPVGRPRSMSVVRKLPKKNDWETVTQRVSRSDTVLMALSQKEELMQFVTSCEVEQLKQLFEIGHLKNMPLMHLVVQDPESRRREPKVEFLIQKKVDPNQLWHISEEKRITPLHFAIESIKVLTLMALIERGGADINAVGFYRKKSRRLSQKWEKKTPLDISEYDSILEDYIKRRGGVRYCDLAKT